MMIPSKTTPLVLDVLQSLIAQQALLAIRSPNTHHHFTTASLTHCEINTQTCTLVFSHDKDIQPLLTKEKKVHLSGYYQETRVEWDAEIIDVHPGPCPEIILRFPDSIAFQERRFAPRITIPSQRRLMVVLEPHHSAPLLGRLCNLSMTGFMAEFPGSLNKKLHVGGRIPTCTIQLSSKLTLLCEVEVRHIPYHRGLNITRVGARFLDLDARQQYQLNRYIQRKMEKLADSVSKDPET